jgi:hypothetical protein
VKYLLTCLVPIALFASQLITPQAQPSKRLLQLLSCLDVSTDQTLESIIETTQNEWLRKNQPRWQMHEKCIGKKEEALKIIDAMGNIQAVYPKKRHYQNALILGASIQAVRNRMAFLIQEYEKGLRVNEIIILGSDRPLDSEKESLDILLDKYNGTLLFKENWHLTADSPNTEFEMMKVIYHQTEFPEGFDKIKVTFIRTPHAKASTNELVMAWLETNPNTKNTLAISSQPYVAYQDAVLKTHLDFNIETIGRQAHPNTLLSVHLDNIARTLYQENILRLKMR